MPNLDSSVPVLIGGRCTCGHVFFPMQHYGCEQCGSREDLTDFEMPARGRLATMTTVHVPVAGGPKPPFAVALVHLDDGPTIRAFVSGTTGSRGQRMHGVFRRNIQDALELVFIATEGTQR
ncbi:Zn-ribbon domain-containing OB-fold protein [Pseudonocardia spinosispora]|uniref:Zn-ribbon domain-containing OB-fold protein n=1 Tax=Pseudonocardia spinosispora TaxID=103441 RepID=UPI00040304DF|nr:OB-fold domain-containing protein [Pseudonocardia spinosispora]